MDPSSSNKGFFQEPPFLPNQFHEDVSFQRALRLFIPQHVREQVSPEIERVGEDVLQDRIFQWIVDAEHNKPYLKGSGRDTFGRPTSELVTGEGWRKLQEFGIEKGFVAAGYDQKHHQYNRVIQFLRLHLWEGSAANVTCPSAMTDGAAGLLQAHITNPDTDQLKRKVLQNAFDHLISRDPKKGWTSGQWMTERTGGSDVSLTETIAKPAPRDKLLADAEEEIPLGPWSISGFKWFSSATDSSMTILLAQTERGLSAFFAPMRRHNPMAKTMVGDLKGKSGKELNGVRIQRLKNKFGTQSVPTGELELDGMRGWLLGEEGRGINEISTVLTLTRIHSTIACLGYVGRGLGVAKAYARVRQVGAGRGRRMFLTDSPLHMRTLAKMATEYHGLMLLAFFTIYILGLSEHPNAETANLTQSLETLTPPKDQVPALLRVLTPLLKAYVCKKSIPLMYSCMESLGGIGYLLNEEQEYLNLARLFRDACVNSIWEGTTDVLATDFLRALKHPREGKDCIQALDNFIRHNCWPATSPRNVGEWTPLQAWEGVKHRIMDSPQDDLVGYARDILWTVSEALIGILMSVDSKSDGDGPARDMFARFVAERAVGSSPSGDSTEDALAHDRAIVYRTANLGNLRSKPKL